MRHRSPQSSEGLTETMEALRREAHRLEADLEVSGESLEYGKHSSVVF